jgi:hypothetical protein
MVRTSRDSHRTGQKSCLGDANTRCDPFDRRLPQAFINESAGLPAHQPADYDGKVLECASFCAERYRGKETVLGEITMRDVRVTALLPAQRCTVASVADHTMYERSNPSYERVFGMYLDLQGISSRPRS